MKFERKYLAKVTFSNLKHCGSAAVCPTYVVQAGDSLYSIQQKFDILSPGMLTVFECRYQGRILPREYVLQCR